jgi:hypothetical protein
MVIIKKFFVNSLGLLKDVSLLFFFRLRERGIRDTPFPFAEYIEIKGKRQEVKGR